jgi:hypothetical protein
LKKLDPKTLIEEELPISVRSVFVPAIKTAYAMVANHISEFDWLNWRVGRDLHRLMQRVAVEYMIKKAIESRHDLPIKCYISPNSIDSCYHLELRTMRSIITISQVATPGAVPRKAIFRSNNSLYNGPRLIFPGINDDDDFKDDGPYYIILTHGYYRPFPEHICLGVPEVNVKRWMYQTDNLLKQPYKVDLPAVERITEETLLEFKDHVKEVFNKREKQ